MVADVAGWIIFATAIAFLACGCHFTRPEMKLSGETSDQRFDRAA